MIFTSTDNQFAQLKFVSQRTEASEIVVPSAYINTKKMNFFEDLEHVAGTVTGRLLVILLIILLLGYGNWAAYSQWSTTKSLERHGQIVQAEVTNLSTARNRSFVDYFVTYRLPACLNPDGKTHDANVRESAYREAEERRTIGVKFLADHPEIQRVVGSKSPTSFLMYVAFFDLLLIIVIFIVLRGL